MVAKKISQGQITLGLLKSLFLQTSFSYQKKQGKGANFVFRQPRLREFNTNPYLFPAIFGLWLKEGEEKIVEYSQIFGATGDDFFWRLSLPFFSLLAIVSLCSLSPSLFAILLPFLIPYNCLTFFTRIWGFSQCYQEGARGALRLIRFLRSTGFILELLMEIVIGFLFFSFLLLVKEYENSYLSPLFFFLTFLTTLLLYQMNSQFTPARIFFGLLILLIFLVIL